MKLIEIAHFTRDVDEMVRFYQKLLGAPPAAHLEDMAVFVSDGVKTSIHLAYPSGEGELPPEKHLAYAVDDVDEACEKLQAAGLTIEFPPQDYYWGRSAYLRDPDGNLIELANSGS